MDIVISETGKFYTLNLTSEHSVNFTLQNLNVPVHMKISEEMFFMDSPDEVMTYVQQALSVGLTASLNGNKMALNPDNAVVYSS